MDILTATLLSSALSIDALVIGLSCGMRKIRISFIAKLAVAAVCFLSSAAAVTLGGVISVFLPGDICRLIGALLLLALGAYVIIGAVRNAVKKNDLRKDKESNLLKNTTGILYDPGLCDADRSNALDFKEALILGAAISADSFAGGLGVGFSGSGAVVPILCAAFHLIFLCAGEAAGKRILRHTGVREQLFSAAAGVLLIVIAVGRLL